MQFGRMLGIVFVILGAALTGWLEYQLANHGGIYKIMIAGPVFLLSGVAMFAVPGADVSTGEVNASPGNPWWEESSMANKVVWVVAGGIGMAYAMIKVF